MTLIELKMHRVGLNKIINQIMSLLYKIGIWHRGEVVTVRETRTKLVFCFYYLLFPISLACGAMITDETDESIFLTEVALICSILAVRAFFIIWKKIEIVGMLNRYGFFSLEQDEDLNLVNDALNQFERLCFVFMFISFADLALIAASPFFLSERFLLFNIAFPFDWMNNDIAFWIAHTFIVTEIFICTILVLISMIIPYLLINCDLKYKILGNKMAVMGDIKITETTQNKRIFWSRQKENIFFREFVAVIDSHQQIREYFTRFKII